MTEGPRKSSETIQAGKAKKDCGCGCSGDCGGKGQTQSAAEQSPKYTKREVDEARRKFAKVAAASPVLMSLVSKSALGGVACSPSGAMSGNISGHDHTECTGTGCTPGFWSQNLDAWSCAGKNPGECLSWNGNSGKCAEWNTEGADTFEGSFGFPFPLTSSKFSVSNYTLLDAMLHHRHWGAEGTYYFHLCAALLNSLCAPYAYGSTEAEIIAFAEQVEDGQLDKQTALQVLTRMNEAGGCYLNSKGECKSGFVYAPDPEGDWQCIPSCPEGYAYDFCQNTCRPNDDPDFPDECRGDAGT